MNTRPFLKTQFGPCLDVDGATFQLWAPSAKQVAVLVEDRPAVALSQDAAGFWRVAAPAAPGDLYRFDIDGLKAPDPASRFQPRDVEGPSQVIDPRRYGWRRPDWRGRPWTEAVIYELHVGLMGGFNGVRARLAELAALGVTAIELMPINDFAGQRNWGYDGVLPFAPDSAYGEPDDLRALIDDAHGLGLMVFLDVVYNHFGPSGNWLPTYAGEFFEPELSTPWGPAIDFRQAAVRRFFAENALYWLEDFRFDGLRLDAVHAIQDRGWLVELSAEIRARIPGRQIHLILENETNDADLLEHDFDAQWNDDFHNVVHVLLTGETHAYYGDFADRPAEKLARCLSQGFVYQGQPSPYHQGRARGHPSASLPTTAFVSFLQNHDQIGNRALGERLTRLADPGALRAAMALLLLMPQIPMLFMGEEWGAREPFLFFTDFHGDLARAVREGRRNEFRATPGFSDEDDRDHIPDPNAETTFLASHWTADATDSLAWRDWVKALLALRKRLIVPRLAGARGLDAHVLGDAAVRARWTLNDGATLTLAVNLGPTPVDLAWPTGEPILGEPPADGRLAARTTLAWIEP